MAIQNGSLFGNDDIGDRPRGYVHSGGRYDAFDNGYRFFDMAPVEPPILEGFLFF